MEWPYGRGGPKKGDETGQEKKTHGARDRGQRCAQGYRAGKQEGRKSAGQERVEPDKGAGMCEVGRGRGRLEFSRLRDIFEGTGGRGWTNGAGGEGVKVSVGRKGGGAGTQRVNGGDAGRGGGQRGGGGGERGRSGILQLSRGEDRFAAIGGRGWTNGAGGEGVKVSVGGKGGGPGTQRVNGGDAGRGGGQRGGGGERGRRGMLQLSRGEDRFAAIGGRGWTNGAGGEGVKVIVGGKGGGAGMQRVNGGDAGRGGGQRGGGGGGRGGSRGEGAMTQRGGVVRNGEPGADGREGATGWMAEMGVRRRGQSLDARGGRRGERGGALRDRPERNGERSNSTGRAGAPQGRRLGYKTLEILAGEEPSLVAIALSSNPALPDVLRETTMRQDLVELLCLVLSKAFASPTDRGSLRQLASIIKDSGFFRTVLPHYLAGMESEVNPLRRAKYPPHLENILAILCKVLIIVPASSIQAVSLLLTLLQHTVNTLSALGVDIQAEIGETVAGLQGQVLRLQRRSREGALTNGGEQEDFWNTPIYPTHEELQLDHRPFLRPNLTSGRYVDTKHYLDTQFRLLREDFVKPLRDGIQQFLWNQIDPGRGNKTLKAKKFDNVYAYFDTRLLVLNCTNIGLAYTVQFDVKPLKSVQWQNSKRLINGSLVCLTCDHFESFLFATVSDRDLKDLKKGQVQIMFTEESRLKLAEIQKDQVFLMIETTAFFEAYRYVLEGLQEQVENDLPFQRYIVECRTDVQPPAYLQRHDKYDLSSITEPKYQKKAAPFRCLEADAWPKMEQLGLDESQMKALQLAITKELAIIQGPPGTGKTHVGLKIAQALLNNRNLWGTKFGTGTILVVCYTNHALDQFLERIHKFLETGIVRVGGCSKSEILKPFNLRELSRAPNFKRSLPSHLCLAYKEIKREMYEEERNILSQNNKLECSLKGILRDSVLKTFIFERHWHSLRPPTTANKKSSLIMEWLNLGSIVFLKRETETSNRNEAAPAEEAMELEDEDLIEIAEEADLIQAERIIEDNIGPRGGRDGRMKEIMKSAVREVEELMLVMNLDEAEIQAEQSEEGWEMQRDQRIRLKNEIRNELRKSSAMTEEEANHVLNVWTLSLPDRWRLYRLWVARYRSELRTSALQSEQAYQNAVERLADVRRHESLCILRKAKVIGMTTTGAAKWRKVLQEVGPRLVIVEEAAQVLEAHSITTLSEACQHLILIGDHQQLQPSTTVYELGQRYNMKISMFERLVKMGVPFVRLNYQHRMRPEIARLLTPHIYPELENHPSVFNFDKIKGIKTSIFFVEHNYPEEIGDGTSHRNPHEAEFVVALCRYLLLQDYKPEQITILTTYNSQLYCLRKLMPASEFSGVTVVVVDKYQGEENDIVLLSLVRSNMQGKVGFLSIPNRVCVALSRARKGLYFIGSSATLRKAELWRNIFHTLRENDQIGSALTLYCQNHPKRQVEAACAKDFEQAPEGGCTKPCQFVLGCGHVCQKVCHPYDPEHEKYKCVKKCQRILCDLGHRCPLECHRKCPQKCPVKVKKIIPQCQHTQMVPCHQDPETFECKEPCQKILMCGHPCDSTCGGQCTSMCNVKVTLKLNCGHSQQDACFYKTQTEKPACRAPCVHQLKCGHPCCGTCAKCYQGRFHVLCFLRCERLLVCAHKCSKPCFCDGSSCQRPCENRCVHSKCLKPCGQPCIPCTEPCAWQCPHQRCSKLCHEPCDRSPCSQPCAKTLDCGHPCIGLCGEKCPRKCRICNHDELRELLNGTEDGPEAYFVQLEDCGHSFEYTAMDKYMGMNGNEQANGEEVARSLKQCPKCSTPIRKNLRYGSHIKRSLAKIETVKVKINGQPADIAKRRGALKKQWKENHDILQQYNYMDISSRLNDPNITPNNLWVLENQMDFLTRVAKLNMPMKKNMSISNQLESDVAEFVHWLGDVNQNFTDQQVFDLQRRLQRLVFTSELNGLVIGEEEKKWILSTRKTPSRHWYK